MQVCWVLLLGRFIGPGKLGQRSHAPRLSQEAFIDLRQRMMTCLPRAGTVPQYGQKLNPWQALGEGGLVTSENQITSAFRNVELGFWCHSSVQSLLCWLEWGT